MGVKKFRRAIGRLKAGTRSEKLDVPGQILEQLAVIKKMIPDYDDDAPPQKLDAERILGMLADMRKKLPLLDEGPRQSEDARTRLTASIPVETEEDFEWAAVKDGVEALLRDVSLVAAQKRAEVLEMALRAYYAMEEASRDPANAHLIEEVKQLRAAYERDPPASSVGFFVSLCASASETTDGLWVRRTSAHLSCLVPAVDVRLRPCEKNT